PSGSAWDCATRTQEILCMFLCILVDFYLKRESLTDCGTLTISRKGRNVDKYLRATLSGSDKSKTAIIIPFCEIAFDTHMKGLT
ncbi:MAG: hypothetical protein WBQ69_02380, partial [Gallionella sp.]